MKKSAIQHYLASLMNDLTLVLVTGESLAAGAEAQNNAALVCLCATAAFVRSHRETVTLETERSTNGGRLGLVRPPHKPQRPQPAQRLGRARDCGRKGESESEAKGERSQRESCSLQG